ncbi:MAG: glycosyltransferase [Vulcanisaeta sp.]
MSDLPRVCVAVSTYFTGEVIYEVLKSIANLDYPRDRITVNVIIAKDDHTTYDYVLKASEDLNINVNTYIVDAPNVDVERNVGIKSCDDAPYILLMDDDAVLHPNTVKKALSHFSDNGVCAVVFPTVGECRSLVERLHSCRYLRGIFYGVNTTMPVTMLRRDVLDRVGLFREDMGPPYSIHEDWEMGSRIRKSGCEIVADGELILRDLGDQTLRKRKAARINDRPARRGILGVFTGYVRSYANRNWWSMLQVFKSSPTDQLLEYTFYFINPVFFILLLIINWLWGVAYLGIILIGTVLDNLVKGYYRVFSVRYRILYPLLMLGIRTLRTYFFLIGLLVNAFKRKR